VLVVCHVSAAAPDPTNQNDHAAGIATILFSAPALATVSALPASGAGPGRAARATRGTSQRRS